MPIEIRELVVRARVEPRGSNRSTSPTENASAGRVDEASVTKACVREVLRILDSRQER